MKVDLKSKASADLNLILVDSKRGILNPTLVPDNVAHNAQNLLADATFKAKKGHIARAAIGVDTGPGHIAIFCIGKAEGLTSADWLEIGGTIYGRFKDSGNQVLAVHGLSDDAILHVGQGVKLAAYRYEEFKTKLEKDDGPSLQSAELITDQLDKLGPDWARVSAVVEGTYLCRDLVNAPPSHLYPETFAKRLESLSELGVKVKLVPEAELAALGMHSMLGVGQGSVRDSYMVQMEWAGGPEGEDPVVLCGKGVCFDTGGVSLKPGANMEAMRGDMGGAAAVSGTMLALAKAGVKANVVGLVGLVENMPDGNAIRPGDILHSASGQTIEVQNTDAEGRLVLCDLLWYAQTHFTPQAVVDLATLTGAIVISLGHEHAGLFSPDDALAVELLHAGQTSNETVWRLPLGKRYDNLLKSQFADMRNIGGRAAGSITAAHFLGRFVHEGTRWAHLDIAGVAWVEGDKKSTDPSWASGFGPGLLTEWIISNYTDA